MRVVRSGDGVLELVSGANDRLILAAPYIKSRTLRRLLDAVPKTVSGDVPLDVEFDMGGVASPPRISSGIF